MFGVNMGLMNVNNANFHVDSCWFMLIIEHEDNRQLGMVWSCFWQLPRNATCLEPMAAYPETSSCAETAPDFLTAPAIHRSKHPAVRHHGRCGNGWQWQNVWSMRISISKWLTSSPPLDAVDGAPQIHTNSTVDRQVDCPATQQNPSPACN